MVRLVRSKGVGVYFVTQNPADIPDPVLAQLGNRIQHALRAYTPKERKAIKAAAESFRPNPAFSTETAITELGVGEALVSTLGDKGIPGVVERTLLRPPASRLDPLGGDERRRAVAASPLGGKYDQPVDRESAYEILQGRAAQAAREQAVREQVVREEQPAREPRRARTAGRSASRSDTLLEATAKSVLRTVGREVGRSLVRGLLGSLLR